MDSLIEDGLATSILERPSGFLREVWIAIRTDGLPGSSIIGDGGRGNPWDASTALKFDFILSTLVDQNTIIHLGPGVFRTGGVCTNNLGYNYWSPKSGQKIIGAGAYQTTILLTAYGQLPSGAPGVNFYSIIVSAGYLDGFALSDLTLDCGNDDQPLPPDAQHRWPQTTCAAIFLSGKNITVRRVRFVNLGNRGPLKINGYGADGDESYPAILANWGPNHSDLAFNHILEDCTFEQVFHSNGRETSPVTQGVQFVPGKGFPKGFAMRRCFFDMDFKNRLPYPPTKIRKVTYTVGTIQTVETGKPLGS